MAVFHGNRAWVYPLKVKGRFSGWHRWSSLALLLFLLVVPWLRWDGKPVFLLEITTRTFFLLGSIFTATDGILILLTLLSAAFMLFFFTSLFGRLWCGYFCPQSVFMLNLAFPVEEWIEGERGQRMRRNQGPWVWDKIWRKGLKWSIYAVLGLIISMSFMGFFVNAHDVWTFNLGTTGFFFLGLFSALWFLDMAWYREQTCNYICPYARFQGALTDDESLVIAYETVRGEPRGKAAKERGGCIDCKRCVAVCPQGIDIRDGYQLECIACGLCIDACTDVMERLGHPTLVKYTTIAADEGRVVHWIRPRTIAYSTLLTLLVGGFTYVFSHHAAIEVLVDRVPGMLFIEDQDGFVRNMYMVKVLDRTAAAGEHDYDVTVDGLPEGSQVLATKISVNSTEQVSVPLIVRVPRAVADETIKVRVTVHGPHIDVGQDTTFKGPGVEIEHHEEHEAPRHEAAEHGDDKPVENRTAPAIPAVAPTEHEGEQ